MLPVHVFCVGFIRQIAHVSQLFLFKSPHDIRIQWREKVTIFDQRCFTSAAIGGFFDTKEENLGVEIESKKFYRRNKCRCRFSYLVLFLSLFLRGDINCRRQEEPAILISRLLLRMRRMRLYTFVWTSTKNEWNAQNAIWSLALNYPSLAIWSHTFWPSITLNLCKPQRLSKSVLTFDRFRSYSVTFGYY